MSHPGQAVENLLRDAIGERELEKLDGLAV